MSDNITLPRDVVEEVRELIRIAVYSPYGSEFRDPYKHQQAALATLDAALAEPSSKVRVDPTAFTASAFSQAAVLKQAEAFETAYQTKRATLYPALAEPEPDAIARAVEAAVKECVTICERQRVKILKNPADPSWTEHLADVQSAMKQRFSVEMGYHALAEPEPYTLAELFAQFAAKQKPLDADMSAIINANLDSLYITDEPAATLAEPHAKREPATDEQIVKAGGECAVVDNEYLLDFRDGFRAAERFHGIGKEDKT